MSSLIRCTDDLLQQRAVQSSHYERLERQLADRERRRRAVVMTLQQRIADVERRGNDVMDLRNERQQLTQQLAQHALQLGVLRYRAMAAQRVRLAAVERLHDGVRGWSGHPAAIVLVVRALQAQKTLQTAGCSLARVLRRVLTALGLHQRLRAFRVRCEAVRQWHTAVQRTLTAQLHARTQRASEVRGAAMKKAAEANAEVDGPLRVAYNTAQQEKLLLEARQDALAIYEAALQERCDVARRDVVVLTAKVDARAGEVTVWEGRLEEATAALAEATAAWSAQRNAYAAVRVSAAEEQKTREDATSEAAESLALVQASVRCTADRKADAEHRVELLRQQALVVGFVVDLCATQRRRRVQRRTIQISDRYAVEAELAQLRAAHAEKLRVCQSARMASQLRTAAEALLRLEGRHRKAAVELEEDEWRLLHAQLVRDACRARATAAATAAAEEKRRSARRTAEKAVASSAATRETRAGGKRACGAPPQTTASARKSAAARRQRLALESVDYVTLTASQGSRTHPVTPTVALTTTATRPSRAACRLVSLLPSVTKQAAGGADAPSSAAVAAATATTPPLKQAKHAHTAAVAVMSPFMAAVSASDSSFSLMPDSAPTDAGAAALAAGRRSTRKDAVLLSTVRVSSTSSASSLLSSTLSPSPRCPAGGHRRVVRPVNVRHSATAAAATLSRRAPQLVQQGKTVRVGGGEGAGSVGGRSIAPRSALDSALMAARTPRPAALGNATAMPAAGAGAGAGGVVRVGSLFPPRSSVGEAGRRRAPPFVAADDLFADPFS